VKHKQTNKDFGRFFCGVFVLMLILIASVSSSGEDMANARDDATRKEQLDESYRLRMLFAEEYYAQLSQDERAGRKARIERKRSGKRILSDKERSRRRRHLEQFRLLKLLEFLDLSEEQEDGFIKSFRKLRRGMVKERKDRHSLMRQLKKAVGKDGTKKSMVYDIFSELKEGRNQEEQNRAAFMERSKVLLSAKQFGRLILFQEQFDAQLLGKLGERGRAPDPVGEMPPPDRFPGDDKD